MSDKVSAPERKKVLKRVAWIAALPFVAFGLFQIIAPSRASLGMRAASQFIKLSGKPHSNRRYRAVNIPALHRCPRLCARNIMSVRRNSAGIRSFRLQPRLVSPSGRSFIIMAARMLMTWQSRTGTSWQHLLMPQVRQSSYPFIHWLRNLIIALHLHSWIKFTVLR
jgi:hypothetical protein